MLPFGPSSDRSKSTQAFLILCNAKLDLWVFVASFLNLLTASLMVGTWSMDLLMTSCNKWSIQPSPWTMSFDSLLTAFNMFGQFKWGYDMVQLVCNKHSSVFPCGRATMNQQLLHWPLLWDVVCCHSQVWVKRSEK